MTDKELKRLSRAELLEMLLAQVKENEKLKINLDEMRTQLDNRQIVIDKAGSIADAAIQLNGVLDAAQTAAAQYLENIQRLSGEQEAVCQQMEADARKKAEAICDEANAYSQEVHSKADAYWKQVLEKARILLQEQDSLRAIIQQGVEEAPV